MSDERLRELERRWKESETVEDEAAWLKERVRVGDLEWSRLELAACLGHEAAVAVAPPGFKPSWGDWIYRLGTGHWGLESSLRAFVFLLEQSGIPANRDPFSAALQVILCPCNKEQLCLPCSRAAELHESNWDDVLHAYADPVGADYALRSRPALRDELVPWALGLSDPVRDRVEARRREAAGE